jgi:putative flippase GtrA
LSALQSLPLSETNRREVKRFVKFGIVGVLGTITHITLFNVLILGLHFPPIVANMVGFSAAVIQNFTLNRKWTFPETRSRSFWPQLAQFAVVSVLGLVINSLVFLTVSHALEPFWNSVIADPRLAHIVTQNFALAVAIGVTLFWNFFVNRLWTFRSHRTPTPAE